MSLDMTLNKQQTNLLKYCIDRYKENKLKEEYFSLHNIYKKKCFLDKANKTNKDILLSATKNDFKFFIDCYWAYEINSEFMKHGFHGYQLDVIQSLQDIVFGKGKSKTVITIPPRHGKTLLMINFMAWTYIYNAMCRYIYTSYSQQLVLKGSNDVKNILKSELVYNLIGKIIDKNQDSKTYWSTKGGGGGFYAVSMGGAITGFGAGNTGDMYSGAIVIDDPMKASDIRYQVAVENTKSFYTNTLLTRRNRGEQTPIILTMQTLGKEDLSCYIKNNDSNVKKISYAVLNESETKTLIEKIMSVEAALKMKKNPEENAVFECQYQQNPVESEDVIIKTEWWGFYEENVLDLDLKYTFITTDLAFTQKTSSDWSVICCWGKGNDNKIYLLDMYRKKLEYTEIKKDFLLFYDKWKTIKVMNRSFVFCSKFYIEDTTPSKPLISDLKNNIPNVVLLERNKDKYTRVSVCIGEIQNKLILLPKDREFTRDIIDECFYFRANNSHKHDDIVDNIADAITQEIKIKNSIFSDEAMKAYEKAINDLNY